MPYKSGEILLSAIVICFPRPNISKTKYENACMYVCIKANKI